MSVLSVLSVLSLSLLLAATLASAQVDDNHRLLSRVQMQGLAAFYEATDGAAWTVSTRWKTLAELDDYNSTVPGTTDACGVTDGFSQPAQAWAGVTCLFVDNGDGTQRPFIRLELPANNVRGSFPVAFSQADAIVLINLESNFLTNVPPQLDELSSLQELTLTNNTIEDVWPARGETPAALRSLRINNNPGLTGEFPTHARPDRWRRMTIEDTSISGTLPAADLVAMIELEQLFMRRTSLEGPLPADMSTMVALRDLYFSDTNISALPINFPPVLEDLAAARCAIATNVPSTINDAVTLREVTLANNALFGTLPPLDKLVNIETFLAEFNSLTGQIVLPASGMPSLRTFSIADNQLDGTLPSQFGLSPDLVVLDLHRNSLSGSLSPSTFRSSMSSMVRLSLFNNSLTGTVPATIGELTTLQELYMHNNAFSGTAPTSVNNILDLTENTCLFDVTYACPFELQRCFGDCREETPQPTPEPTAEPPTPPTPPTPNPTPEPPTPEPPTPPTPPPIPTPPLSDETATLVTGPSAPNPETAPLPFWDPTMESSAASLVASSALVALTAGAALLFAAA